MKKNVLFVVLMLALVLVGCAEHEHVWNEGEISKDASCTEAGEMTYTCETCKATRTEAIPAMGHSFEFEVTTPATCIEDGVGTEICSRCSAKGETRSVAAAHEYDSNGECTVCHAKKDDVDKAEARIGTTYFETLTKAIESLKAKEEKVSVINILKASVKLEDLSGILGSSNSEYKITFDGSQMKEKPVVDIRVVHSYNPTGTGTDGTGNKCEGANLVFNDVVVLIGGNANYQGFIRSGDLTFDGCSIRGYGSYWGVGDVKFVDCFFEQPKYEFNAVEDMKQGEGQWETEEKNIKFLSGKSFTFENCVFENESGEFITTYQQYRDEGVYGKTPLKVNISGCTFRNTGENTSSSYAIKIKPEQVYEVRIGAGNTYEGIAKGKNSGFVEFEVEENLKPDTKVFIVEELVFPKSN